MSTKTKPKKKTHLSVMKTLEDLAVARDATIISIGEAAGLPRQTVHHHFNPKAEESNGPSVSILKVLLGQLDKQRPISRRESELIVESFLK